MKPSKHFIDALFVINQDADFNKIRSITQEEGFGRILLLCTHHLFKNERAQASKIAPEVLINTFADFLNDAQMQSCDDRATVELAPLLAENKFREKYMHHFTGRSLKHKNEAVFKNVRLKYAIGDIYYHVGLGIHQDFWQSTGARSLVNIAKIRSIFENFIRKVIRMPAVLRTMPSRKVFPHIFHGSDCYIFLCSLNRLKLIKQAAIHQATCSMFQWTLFVLFSRQRKRVMTEIIKNMLPGQYNLRLAVTIHEYTQKFTELNLPLYVLVDGYHPSNYPRSYIDMYSNCKFVVRDMFDDRWFSTYGKKMIKALPFLETNRMKTVKINSWPAVKTVLLVLNHAGDWTALINRSDTDLLIEAFADLAAEFQDLMFIIRPHPTMATPEHEGVHSLKRIKNYVASKAINNLVVSESSLEEDMKRGDLFVSEYSQVLIDAFQAGKLGIIVNLTCRRNFMEDYEKLGFFTANSAKSLKKKIFEICQNPAEAIQQQKQAAVKYNHLLIEEGYCINS